MGFNILEQGVERTPIVRQRVFEEAIVNQTVHFFKHPEELQQLQTLTCSGGGSGLNLRR